MTFHTDDETVVDLHVHNAFNIRLIARCYDLLNMGADQTEFELEDDVMEELLTQLDRYTRATTKPEHARLIAAHRRYS